MYTVVYISLFVFSSLLAETQTYSSSIRNICPKQRFSKGNIGGHWKQYFQKGGVEVSLGSVYGKNEIAQKIYKLKGSKTICPVICNTSGFSASESLGSLRFLTILLAKTYFISQAIALKITNNNMLKNILSNQFNGSLLNESISFLEVLEEC